MIIFVFSLSQFVLADGVVFATSDDIKAFDSLLKNQKIAPRSSNSKELISSVDKMIVDEKIHNQKDNSTTTSSGNSSLKSAQSNGKALGKDKIKSNKGKKK
jgi:hypothetical protein